jgi:hypothetical protein
MTGCNEQTAFIYYVQMRLRDLLCLLLLPITCFAQQHRTWITRADNNGEVNKLLFVSSAAEIACRLK